VIDTQTATYDVGGVRLERPFRVRRLGHFGFNCIEMEACLEFYTKLVGFRISDKLDLSKRADSPEQIAGMGDPSGYFMRHGTEHHSFVLFNKRVREAIDKNRRFAPGVTINQMSWHVGSLEEVVHGNSWVSEQGLEIQRSGRDMPGSNWHCYFYDPDGHTNELFYGMEQIGWEGRSKPFAMHDRGFRQTPELPQPSEEDEVDSALARGVAPESGYRYHDVGPREYDVEGVLLPRPFKLTKMGPISMFVADVDASAAFYQRYLGFELTEITSWNGHRAAFLRANTEHHSMALYPLALRAELGLRADSTIMSFGVSVGSYRQLVNARSFFVERGARIVDIPGELYPGIDYAFHVLDPDGHCLQFYFSMEQIGWDGRPRPASARPKIDPKAWPAALEATSDVYKGEVFLGPLG
jgi:catechol 2,3-dioxygenase-like lactoylglutathione lyase family enzyme